MTDDLIERLAADLKPVSRHAMRRLVLAATSLGIAGSVLLMLFWLGLRPDLATAATGPIFWIKFAYTAGIALLGLPALLALARPGGQIAWPWIAMAAVVICLAAAALMQLSSAPASMTRELVLGSTALICPFYIVAISAPVLASALAAMRRLAPTRPALAGLAAGLLSGGAGACVYSLYCTEIGLPFLLTWYSFGILAVSLLAAVLGKLFLRW